jgi:membrane-associated protease RseP (regulator of RpoE activity)
LFHGVGVLVVVLALVAMVMLHEFGHFATAKWTGMKVTEFFFGFGPRLWSVRRKETTYGIKALPAGGYVRIVGMTMLEDVDPNDEPHSYRQATFPRRVLVASAGSLTHFILAFVLLWVSFLSGGVPASRTVPPTVTGLFAVAGNSAPARAAGIRNGDVFVSINGQKTSTYTELHNLINKSAGKKLLVVVRRSGRLVSLLVTPASGSVCSGNPLKPHKVGEIGVELETQVNTSTPSGALGSVGHAGSEFGSMMGSTFQDLAQVFSLHGLKSFGHAVVNAGKPGPTGVCAGGAGSTPGSSSSASSGSSGQILSFLGFIQVGSQAFNVSIPFLLELLALVNLFVGVVNLFPMLPLDGGHVAIAVYERIRSRGGRRYFADITRLLPFAYLFLAFIVVIGLAALYLNIVQPAHLPGG